MATPTATSDQIPTRRPGRIWPPIVFTVVWLFSDGPCGTLVARRLSADEGEAIDEDDLVRETSGKTVH